ncbi:hypothetical protein B0H67DRAFT_613427 [Lasiosphaeris hirsuta]|uniref:2EXR domain-containing protein n=1 Tax=Lasiosphaeris hirsuta TaxID=260670 RepID=A0AA39ZWL5_9PEZI|nr:hypothetical protein B0H67DRAFT_613427 [Lasiosphaeris hirsuta]
MGDATDPVFTVFPRLPPEIQRMIWIEAALVPRVICFDPPCVNSSGNILEWVRSDNLKSLYPSTKPAKKTTEDTEIIINRTQEPGNLKSLYQSTEPTKRIKPTKPTKPAKKTIEKKPIKKLLEGSGFQGLDLGRFPPLLCVNKSSHAFLSHMYKRIFQVIAEKRFRVQYLVAENDILVLERSNTIFFEKGRIRLEEDPEEILTVYGFALPTRPRMP